MYSQSLGNSRSSSSSTSDGNLDTLNVANNKLVVDASESTFNSDLTVNGNLTVTGDTVTSSNMTVTDNLVKFAHGNTSTSVDVGWYAPYGADKVVGCFHDHVDEKFKVVNSTDLKTPVLTMPSSYSYNDMQAANIYGANFYKTGTSTAISDLITNHTSNTSNPHSVTAAQLGLGAANSVVFKWITSDLTDGLVGGRLYLTAGSNYSTNFRIENWYEQFRIVNDDGTKVIAFLQNGDIFIPGIGDATYARVEADGKVTLSTSQFSTDVSAALLGQSPVVDNLSIVTKLTLSPTTGFANPLEIFRASGYGAINHNSTSAGELKLNPLVGDGTSTSTIRLFRDVTTSGASKLLIHPADGGGSAQHELNAKTDSYVCAVGGNFGVGTGTPAYKLDVNGTCNVSGALTASNLAGAEYTPTLTIYGASSSRLDSVTNRKHYYTRVGNVITVYGYTRMATYVGVDTTATPFEFYISLPVAKTFGSAYDVVGIGQMIDTTTAPSIHIYNVSGETAAIFRMYSGSTYAMSSNIDVKYSFSYSV
jgi:hypothetical protein